MTGAPSGRRPDAELDPELARVAGLLDRAAALEAEERREAEALADAPGSRRVEAALASAWGEAPRPRRRWRGLALLAVAASLVVLFLVSREERPSGPRGEYLGDGEVEIVRPAATTGGWDRIEWTGPPDATWRVLVRDAETGADLHGPIEIVRANALALDPETTAGWPHKIRIELERRDVDGTWIAEQSVESALRD